MASSNRPSPVLNLATRWYNYPLTMKKTKSMDTVSAFLGPYARRIDHYLDLWVTEEGCPPALREVMRYCVLNGGKRLRPSVVMLSAEAAGGDAADELPQRCAVAVELIHCYSLVHDDLPSMDNDDLRRGRPTAHVLFGEAMAILAGDALLTRAFGVLCEAVQLDNPQNGAHVGRLVWELTRGAGSGGMVAGQVADMDLCEVPEGPEGLDYIHRNKTAALIRAAGRMGAICANSDEKTLAAITGYCESLGMAYQLVDDLLDVSGQITALGKTPGKDQVNGKRTHVTELGFDRARELSEDLTACAVEAISPLCEKGQKLQTLARLLVERNC